MSRSKKKKSSSGKLFKKIILIAVLVGIATFALGMLLNKDEKESAEFNPNNGESIIYCYKCGEESLTGENICYDCKEENSNESLETPDNTQKPDNTEKPEKPEEDKEDTNETVKPEEPTKPENPQPEKPKYKCVVCKQLVDKVSDTSDGPACAKCIENVNSGMYTCINGYSDVCRGCSKCMPTEEEDNN